MQYNFDSLADMADFFERSAKTHRERADIAKRVGDKNEELSKAVENEWVATVIRHSNLIQGRLIMVDSEMDDAKKELRRFDEACQFWIEEVQGLRDELVEKLRELDPVTAAELDKERVTP